jgi:hypothetical protein
MTQTGSVAEGRLSDWISLGVLASWVPRDAVDEAVEATGKGAKRKGGKLPPHVMVYFAMALALLAGEDYEETWVRLSETLAEWGCWDSSQGTVTAGGLTQARQRLGHEPMREVFAQVARPVAAEDTPGAFLGPWRKMSMDGLEWDIPDTKPNAAAFGYPGTGKDDAPAAFPKARAVTVGECASRAPALAAIGPCVSKGSGEQSLARQLYPQLREDWLLIADRNLYNWQDWCTAADTGAALLGRVKSGLTLPPLEFYPDGSYRSVLVNRLFEVNRDGVLVRLPGVFSCWLRCVICVGGRGCRRCGRARAGSPGSGTRRRGGPRAWRAGSGSRRQRS